MINKYYIIGGIVFLIFSSILVFYKRLIKKDKINKSKVKKHKDGRTYFDLYRGLKNLKKRFLVKPSKIIVVDLELQTGDFEHHLVEVNSDNTFKLFGKKYIVDDTFLVYNRTFRQWSAKYHENISLPIKQTIDIKEIKDAVNRSSLESNISSNLDPRILEEYSKSTVIQKVLQGAQLDNLFNKMLLMLILILIGTGVSVLLLLNTSGVF